MNRKAVLIVDDEADIRELLVLTLSRMGVDADTAASFKEAQEALKSRPYDLALTDMRLPDGDGLMVLKHIAENYGNTPVAVITAFGSTENAVAALKAGAFDYLAKPIKLEQLRPLVMSALKLPRPAQTRRGATGETAQAGVPRLLGESPAMQRAREMIGKLARSQAPVYITGESGSGKEVAARLIHIGSARADAPFVAVNCGAIPSNLIEAELFGYEKGSFTGATRQHRGCFERAEGGTLFLDEITEMAPEMQVRLLRVLETGRYTRVGGEAELSARARVLAATNRDPRQAVQDGLLREDLLYRLAVFPIALPALCEREGDAELLAEHFLQHLNAAEGTDKHYSRQAIITIRSHRWPGNVRELRNAVQRAFIMADDEIDMDFAGLACAEPVGACLKLPIGLPLAELERQMIYATLDHCDGNKRRCAQVLGISLKTLYNRLTEYQSGAVAAATT
jgi:two-component system response regulator PilR (NtrC family)